jgi:4'-phosphopantetheinyl transferase
MWSAPPEELRLNDGEIHVWRAELTAAETGALLDERERERAARFHFERDRIRFIAAHSALRRILALYLRCSPEALRFAHTKLGKPRVEGPFRFSMSHSGDVALYAIAQGEIGVDVEQVREGIDVIHIAERFLPAEEVREIGDSLTAFFRLWTRREAYLKARGIGIRGVGEAMGPGWFIAELDPGPGYAGAVAIEAPEARVLTWECRRAR